MLSPRRGGSGIGGAFDFLSTFSIKCPAEGNKYWSYYINKSHSVQIAPTRGQNTNQNPQGGDAFDDQIPPIHDRCITKESGIRLITKKLV